MYVIRYLLSFNKIMVFVWKMVFLYRIFTFIEIRSFEVKTTFEDNKILYVVTTRGELFPDNTQSKAITFDFQRLDKKKLTKKEEKFSDDVFNQIIKDKPW